MERLTEWVGSGPDRKAIARQDRRDVGDKDCVARLADYEDTGITPEAVIDLQERFRSLYHEFNDLDLVDPVHFQAFLERVRRWNQADQAGRLVVLPGEDYCWRIRGDIAIGLILANCRSAQWEAEAAAKGADT